jgi:hypothetical protein
MIASRNGRKLDRSDLAPVSRHGCGHSLSTRRPSPVLDALHHGGGIAASR